VKIFCLLFILLSCSSMSEKQVMSGQIRLDQGRKVGEVWNDSLSLKRKTWFHGMKIEFDNYFGHITKDSKFMNWFGEAELAFFNDCSTIVLSLTNTNFHHVFANHDIVNQMSLNNFSKISAPVFIKNFKLHPEYRHWNLSMYEPKLFCSTQKINSLTLSIPSYEKTEVRL